jgi:hypothetical protein
MSIYILTDYRRERERKLNDDRKGKEEEEDPGVRS